jgi:transposase-like protein
MVVSLPLNSSRMTTVVEEKTHTSSSPVLSSLLILMSACPVCKTTENVKPSWMTGYQRRCTACGVLFNETGTGTTL